MNVKHIKLFLFSLLLPLAFTACGGNDDITDNGGGDPDVNLNANVVTAGVPSVVTRMEFPKIHDVANNIIVVQQAVIDKGKGTRGINYCVEWDGNKKSQRWSCYQMYKTIAEQNVQRKPYEQQPQYPDDPQIPANYKLPGDPFRSSSYDHGHICPSDDRLCSRDANDETFYLSNMQPQLNSFNAEVWENMESQVRTWFKNSPNDTLYICKGGTIDNANQILTTTNKGMIVPAYYYMAILQKNKSGYKALGFWIKHEPNADEDLSKYVVNIADLQRNTGIDFFCNLPDKVENTVETLPVDRVRLAWGFRN